MNKLPAYKGKATIVNEMGVEVELESFFSK